MHFFGGGVEFTRILQFKIFSNFDKELGSGVYLLLVDTYFPKIHRVSISSSFVFLGGGGGGEVIHLLLSIGLPLPPGIDKLGVLKRSYMYDNSIL